jgi:carbamoyl-phosphate synthase large subunit
MKILLTGAGGPAAISVWKSLRHHHEIHMADMDPRATGLYLVPETHRAILPCGDAPDFVDAALALCSRVKANVLVSTVDAELAVVASRREEFERLGVHIPLSPEPVLRTCRDKWKLIQACALSNVPVPFTVLWGGNAQFDRFPAFAKPRFGSGSQGLVAVTTEEVLAQLPRDDSYLVQELLPGEEYSVDTYVTRAGQPIAAVPRERLKTDSGIAVAARTRQIDTLVQAAIATARAVGIRYVANIQFKRAVDGQFKLLEINPRFPGTLPLTAAAGVDIPQLLMQDLAGASWPDGLLPFKEVMTVRYWAEHVMLSAEYEDMVAKGIA